MNFSVLIFYPAKLQNLLISSSMFCVESLRFSVYSIMPSTCIDISPLLFQFGYLSFLALISVAGTSKSMLNRRGKSKYPCLVLDFSVKPFSFSSLNIILAVGLS